MCWADAFAPLHSGETLTAGDYRTSWNGRDDEGRSVASGVYLYQLIAGEDFNAVGRMALDPLGHLHG